MELILSLPVFLIFLLAVIEFGLILANLKHVAFASRVGAQRAAESASLNAGTAATIRATADRYLESAGLGAAASQGITLRHNVSGGGVFTDGTCTGPTAPALPTDGSGSVRVTICVPLSRLTPNLLGSLGFSTSGKVAEVTTTFPYEAP